MYKVVIKHTALKELMKQPKKVVSSISLAIDDLSNNPRPIGCKKLNGTQEEFWRIRVGDYRVIYSIEETIRIVSVRKIGHRRDVYE